MKTMWKEQIGTSRMATSQDEIVAKLSCIAESDRCSKAKHQQVVRKDGPWNYADT